MVILMRLYSRLRLRWLQRLIREEFDEGLSREIDGWVAVLEALEGLR